MLQSRSIAALGCFTAPLLVAPLLVAPLLVVVGGCARGTDERAAAAAVRRYAELPGLAATHHKGLRDELARLLSEQTTPRQLDAARSPKTAAVGPDSAPAKAQEPDHKRIEWSRFFRPQTLTMAASRIDAAFPASGDSSLTPIQLASAISLRSSYDPQRRRFDRLIDAPDFHPPWLISEGIAADTSFVEVARLCGRLEGLLAIELQHKGQLDLAVESVGRMLSVASLLAAQPHVVSRITAVYVRADALSVLSLIMRNAACEPSQRRQAMNRIAAELERWPRDGDAWIGDRAVGLQIYEMVRDGLLTSVLSDDEKLRIRRAGSLAELEDAVLAGIDADEMYYLGAMRRLIAASSQPYHQRRKFLEALRVELIELQASTQYPFVADTMLLADFERGHRLQAVDRARMDGWLLALKAATGSTPPTPSLNLLTGEPFRLSVEPSLIVVDGIDPKTEERIVIPLGPAE
ncbi:MAG: hypothetical protein RIC55_17780 [Pirellulaceae bacterium]